HENVVPGADFANLWEPLSGRDNHSTDSLNRFGDKRADRVCPFAFYGPLEFNRAIDLAGRICLAKFAAVTIGAVYMNHTRQAGLHLLVEYRDTAEYGSATRRAVIRLIETDALGLIGLAFGFPVRPH